MNVVLLVGYVQGRSRIAKLFCQAKIDDVDLTGSFAHAHDKIGWFYIAVEEGVGMYVLYSGYLATI